MKQVTIVCDGSSLGNGRGNPRAAAAALGLESLNESCSVTVMSDSRYVVETMGGTWKRKTNHDWWKRLDNASQLHQIKWQWIKGHSGHEIQEIVDKIARKTAELGRVDNEMLDDAVVGIGVQEI